MSLGIVLGIVHGNRYTYVLLLLLAEQAQCELPLLALEVTEESFPMGCWHMDAYMYVYLPAL